MTACTFLDQKWPERREVVSAVRDVVLDQVGLNASSTSARRTQDRTDSVLYATCAATRCRRADGRCSGGDVPGCLRDAAHQGVDRKKLLLERERRT